MINKSIKLGIHELIEIINENSFYFQNPDFKKAFLNSIKEKTCNNNLTNIFERGVSHD